MFIFRKIDFELRQSGSGTLIDLLASLLRMRRVVQKSTESHMSESASIFSLILSTIVKNTKM